MRGVQTALHSAGKELAGRSDAAVFPRFRGQWTQAQFICVHSDVCCSYLLTLHRSKDRLCVHLTGGGTYLQVGHIMGTCESHGRDSVGDMVPTATGKATWAQLTPHGGGLGWRVFHPCSGLTAGCPWILLQPLKTTWLLPAICGNEMTPLALLTNKLAQIPKISMLLSYSQAPEEPQGAGINDKKRKKASDW